MLEARCGRAHLSKTPLVLGTWAPSPRITATTEVGAFEISGDKEAEMAQTGAGFVELRLLRPGEHHPQERWLLVGGSSACGGKAPGDGEDRG